MSSTETKGVQTSRKFMCDQCSNCAQRRRESDRFSLCEICGCRIKSMWNFVQHLSKHAKKDVKYVSDLECPFCGKCMNMRNMKLHLEMNRSGCGKSFHQCKCGQCDLQFLDVDALIEHLPCTCADK